MRNKIYICFFIFLLAGLMLNNPAHARNAQVSINVKNISKGQIILDGRLNESVWKNAAKIKLYQQSPHPGEPTAFHTTVLLLHDSHTLYLGIICDDPDPAKISTSTLMRDQSQSNDDHVTVVLDTFNTQNTAYVFEVNAAGAMADGLLSPTASIYNSVDYQWNGNWQARVRRNTHGWTAEIAINVSDLQFTKDTSTWGFNVSRYVPRDLLTLVWSGVNLNANIFNLHWEGLLHGMGDTKQGSKWAFRPYGVLTYNTNGGSAIKKGFNLRYKFSSSFKGIFTYNTDFSQAQPDQEQINTTRFALSFPETRQFFLQGSNLYRFGYDLTGNAGTTFIPYQSRNIGLVDGVTVPMKEGVKLYGQSQRGSLGFLDIQMGGSDVSNPTNLFVGRGIYNLKKNLQVGTIVTNGDPLGSKSNTFMGADALWHTSTLGGDKNLNVFAWTGRSLGDLPKGSPSGYGIGVDYPNDLWLIRANMNVYGGALDPALGFLPRPGTKQYYLELDYRPRPKSAMFNWIQQFFWHGTYLEVDNINGGKESSEWHFFPNMNTNNGYYYELDFYHEYDAPQQSFNIGGGVVVPAGMYHWNYYGFAFNTPKFKPLVFYASAYTGGYYGGHMQHIKTQVDWNLPPGKLQLTASQEVFFGYLPQGNFHERLSIFGGTYSFTPSLYVTTLVQHSNNIPGVSLYTQLHWRINSTKNIYLIWDRGLVRQTNGLGPPNIVAGNNLILKLQWDFR